MRTREIKRGTNRHDASGINFAVRHVIMALDVIEVDRLSDAGQLIKVHQITLQIRVIDNAADVALEMAMINNIEPNERTEESPVGFDNAIWKQVTAFR